MKNPRSNNTNYLLQHNHLSRRISWLTYSGLFMLSFYFISSSYFIRLETKQQDYLNILEAIAQTASIHIDGDDYESLLKKYPTATDAQQLTHDPVFQKITKALQTIEQKNSEISDLSIISYDAQAKQFFYTFHSTQASNYRQAYSFPPSVFAKNYEMGGKIEEYTDQNGEWMSAFEPIKNKNGAIVAAIKLNSSSSYLFLDARNELIRNLIISLMIALLIGYILRGYLQKVIQITKAKEKAEQQAAIKAKFLSTMSHEIRTPMNAVIGLSNILLQERPREDQVENIQTLKFSADLLLSLINDILDYSKIDAGKIEIEKIPIELEVLVKNIRKTLVLNAKEKGLELKLAVDRQIPTTLLGDPVRISQILTNLIGNAIKFTDRGKVTIQLTTKASDAQKMKIQFSVTDTGIGIPKEKFETIFQSFSQADTTTTRKYGGTGLGLSITKKLIELQNSQIHIRSEIGEGTCFYFDLDFERTEQKVEQTNRNEAEIDPTLFAGTKVLLVEDNKINVMVALKFLKKWGLAVDVAENGLIALEKVQKTDYQMVLMDLDMPVMDGYEATIQIKALPEAKYQNLPIIALSASAVLDFRKKAEDVGMVEFVTKPFKPTELKEVLSRFIMVEQLVD